MGKSASRKNRYNYNIYSDPQNRVNNYGRSKNSENYSTYSYHRSGVNDCYRESYRYYKSNIQPRYQSSARAFARRAPYRKPPTRPATPVVGSEEYMMQKVQQTSALIMRQLMSPEENIISLGANQNSGEKEREQSQELEEIITNRIGQEKQPQSSEGNKNKKNASSYNLEEIQRKIMNHISNLNDGKKKNLINSSNSGYDAAIQQIVKQKRLEISRALRNMCTNSSQTKESTDFINSIIPDIGIKFEELPLELIEELRCTLNFDLDFANFQDESERNHNDKNTELCSAAGPSSEPPDEIPLNNILQPNFNNSQKEKTTSDAAVNMNNITVDLTDHIDTVEIKEESEHSDEDAVLEVHTNNNKVNCNPNNTNAKSRIKNILSKINKILQSDESESDIVEVNKDNDISIVEKPKSLSNIATQTDAENEIITVDMFVTRNFSQDPQNLPEAIDRMIQIDKFVSKLTKYRQSLFDNFKKSSSSSSDTLNVTEITSSPSQTEPAEIITSKRAKKKRKNISPLTSVSPIKTSAKVNKNKKKKLELVSQESLCTNLCTKSVDNVGLHRLQPLIEQNMLEFQEVKEKMLVMKVVEDKLVAAAESGKIFFCSLEDGHYTKVLEVSKVPITSLLFRKRNQDTMDMYVGTFENTMKMYDFHSHNLQKCISIDKSIQCMECNWGYIFIGCTTGSLLRYSIKKDIIEYEDKISDTTILVLKATQEGARKVLLVGSRNMPVCIRDAMNGLHLRTLENVISPTVYSLVIENSLVYCGTTNHNILVFSFCNGNLKHTLKATNSKGIGCLKVMGNLLFASCHNGNIYVYNIKTHKCIGTIAGPGGVILSMEVLENQVIVGTMSFKFKSIAVPRFMLKQRY